MLAYHSGFRNSNQNHHHNLTTTLSPPDYDINNGNVIAVIGALVVFGFVLFAFLSMACHAMCAFCFGKQGVCMTPEEGAEDNSDDSINTVEPITPPIVVVMNKKEAENRRRLSITNIGF